MPAWLDYAGIPIKGIETIDPQQASFSLEIEAKRLTPADKNPIRSGMRYSCDEFPPASFIEGGIGTPGENNPEGDGTEGNTYCAPILNCKKGTKGTSSEQNWQGKIHTALRRVLVKKIEAMRKQAPANDEAVAFQFRTATHTGQQHAARVYYRDKGTDTAVGLPGPPRTLTGVVPRATSAARLALLRRQIPEANATAEEKLIFGKGLSTEDYLDLGWVAVDLIVDEESGEFFKVADKVEVPIDNTMALRMALDSSILPSSNTNTSLNTSSNSSSFVPSSVSELSSDDSPVISAAAIPWNIDADNVEELQIASVGLETQQQHGSERIDIIGLSEAYILGQINQGNTTKNNSEGLNTTSHSIEAAPSAFGKVLRHRQAPVEGPIQCGPGQPCLDGSCCNKDGKCGYKDRNCAPDVCLSNCDAKAMCGIDSADGKTPCGLKLCCKI